MYHDHASNMATTYIAWKSCGLKNNCNSINRSRFNYCTPALKYVELNKHVLDQSIDLTHVRNIDEFKIMRNKLNFKPLDVCKHCTHSLKFIKHTQIT
jgi:hypothetical protein